MEPQWISAGAAVLALTLSALSLWRSSKRYDSAATDQRIDERIELKVGTQIAVMNEKLDSIKQSLAGNAALVRNAVDATASAITNAAETMLRIREQ